MSQEKIVLDYGCGLGGNYKFIKRRGAYVGVDILPENIAYAQKRYGQDLFKLVDGEVVPFADAYFDEVHVYDVLEHVEKLEVVAKELVRVLKPGGKLFIVVPAEVSERKLLALKPDYFSEVGHVRIVRPDVTQTLVESLGCTVVKTKKIRGMEAVVYAILFSRSQKKFVAFQTGSPQFSKYAVAFIWLFDTRLFITSLKYLPFLYVFTLPIGWLISRFFPKSILMECVKH
jgi:SAM-dependent methyltransferase